MAATVREPVVSQPRCVNWQEPAERVQVPRSATPWLLVEENATTPVGVVAGLVSVSATFTVHGAVCSRSSNNGQLTDVDVERSGSAEACSRLKHRRRSDDDREGDNGTGSMSHDERKGYDRPAIATPPDRLVGACPC